MKALIAALLIGLGSAGHAFGQFGSKPTSASEPPFPNSPQPNGASFLTPGTPAVSTPAAGPYFQTGKIPIPQSSALQAPNPISVPAAENPTLPQPNPASGAPPMLPMPPSASGAPPAPFLSNAPLLPNVPDGAYAETIGGPSTIGSGFPAMGQWGARADSQDGGPHLWLSADYMFWWMKKGPMPNPLVVTGPSTDNFPGALDQPNTSILYGGKDINYNPFSGARLSLGLWGGPDNRFGFELGGFMLEQQATKFSAYGGADGSTFLARPFINAGTGFENVYFVSQNFADPTLTALMRGGIDISNTSKAWSYEANGLWNVWRGSTATANLIGGFRSVGLREHFAVNEALQNLAPGGGVFFNGASVDPASTVSTFDKFDTENNFYGGQIGARVLLQRGRFSLNLTGKAAIGVMQQSVTIDGATYLRGANNILAGALPGGVLAQTTNMGRHYQNKFAVVPEGGADLCFNVTERLVVKVGYTFVYLSSVARPGDQINRHISTGVVPTDADYGLGGTSPGFQFKTSSLWMQGANLGVEFRY